MKARFLAIQKHRPNSLIILSSKAPVYKQHDIRYPYESGHVFRYLTRLNIYPCTLILSHDGLLHAFLPAYNAQTQLWHGPQIDTEHASSLKADYIHSHDSLEAWLQKNAKNTRTWITDTVTQDALTHLSSLFRTQDLEDMTPLVDAMRHIKDSFALEETRGAIGASIASHTDVMRNISIDAYEAAIEGQFILTGFTRGYRDLAYPPIVALGKHATILHYSDNNTYAQKDDWLLIDAGWQSPCGYASDITRSYPTNKKATGIRRAVYESLLYAQKSTIQCIRPGVDWSQLEEKIRLLLLESLEDLGIYKRPLCLEDMRTLFPHRLGHWIGLEVHERVPYYDNRAQPIPWTEGMLLTIEPGIYFSSDNIECHPDLRGFGLRIEDNILVTCDGHDNLTSDLPTDLTDIAQA